MGKTVRDSNMELLRIVSMLFIVISHSFVHGLSHDSSCLPDMMCACGYLGVNCFVMITGYFLVTGRVTISKMLKLWVAILTYSLGLYILVCWISPHEAVSMTGISRACRPVTMSSYWFVSVYILLMLISPFLNMFLKSLESKDFLVYLTVLFVLVAIVPYSFSMPWQGGRLPFFILLYSVAAFVRLHGDGLRMIPVRRWLFLFAAGSILAGGLAFIRHEYSGMMPGLIRYVVNWAIWNMYSPLHLCLAFCLLMAFSLMPVGFSKKINLVAASALGVYLTHDHNSLRPLLWNGILHVKEQADSPWLLPYCLGASVVVYIACTLIEFLRQQTLGRLYDWAEPRWILPLAYCVWGGARGAFEKLASRL